jgi:hypothetical protein
MKKWHCLAAVLALYSMTVRTQEVYMVSGGEIIFQSSRVQQDGHDINTNLRFSLFFHVGEYLHMDFGDHIGVFSGIGLRNVGFITDEGPVKIKYRTYNLGVPVALKLGSFNQNLYIFGGAEYEYMVHFKQKVFENGTKTKYSRWFSNRTPDFIPSAFIGFQFPAGIQLKFRYYLNDYLNKKFIGNGIYDDYSRFGKIQVWYISVSFQIHNSKLRNYNPISTEMAFR